MTSTNTCLPEAETGIRARTLVGALVVGGDHPGLGVARSLGRKGIPVFVLDDQCSISKFSKFVTKFIRVKDLRDERCAVEAMLEVGRRYGLRDWVLFPTRDETVAACARYREELSEFFRVTTPEWNTVRWAWNKRNTYELAMNLGIPCPQTFTARSVSELPSLYTELPLAIKPAVKENFFYATGAKAWRADTIDQLQQLFCKACKHIPPEEVLIQEIIPGGGSQQFSYCCFFRDGQPHGSLVARRERQHPREFGRAASYVETVDVSDLEELATRFLRAINYYGLVEVEFKLDPRDGRYKLLDVNARAWGFHSLGFASGVDFPSLLFADQVGKFVAPGPATVGIGWLRMITDLPLAIADLLHGRLNWRAYLASLGRTQIESVFCKDDLLPFAAEIMLSPYLFAKKS